MAAPSGSARRRSAAGLALVALVAAVAAIDVWWLLRYRSGFPLDIDESGYLQLSFTMHDSLRARGPHGLWSAFQHEGWGPPLLPGTTAVLELVWGAGRIVPSIATQLVFLLVLAVATYGIARRLARSTAAGLVAAAAVVAAPGISDFTRTYHMVLPSTAMLTLSTELLLRTERLERRGWAIGWGAALGLTLLARTMMVAFVPALVLGALWMLAVDRAGRRRLLNLAYGLGAAAVTAAVWYATSWHPILGYLRSAGYGSASAQYGPAIARTSIHYWTRELDALVDGVLYLPLALVLALAASTAIVAAVRRRSLGGVVRSEEIVVVALVVWIYLALTSTRNQGTGFTVPLAPLLVALAVGAAFRLRAAAVRAGVVALLLAVSALNVVMKADVVAALSRPGEISLPLLGTTQVVNGEGYIHQNLAANAGYELGPPSHWLHDRDKGWLPMYDALAVRLHRPGRPDPKVRLVPDEPLLNASALRLAVYRRYHEGGDIGYLTAAADSVAGYRVALAAAAPDVVVTVDSSRHPYGAPVTPRLVEAALHAEAFHVWTRVRTPDGRVVGLWRH